MRKRAKTVTIVNVREAKTQLSRLLDRVRDGEAIIIAKAGKPWARMVPYREPGLLKGFGIVVGDEFFEELPEEELRAWEGADDPE